jgi:prepilin-type N-terminal cleavage/methylation domain-containing protein
MHRRAGFTLLEICLAVAIGLMLLLIAVPSIKGAMDAKRLHERMNEFDALVTKAQVRAVSERKTMALVWKHDAIELISLDKAEEGEAPETFSVGKDQEYILERPAALTEKAPPIWTFWRSGACEPVIVTYKGPDGMWRAQYDALTARRTILEEQLE